MQTEVIRCNGTEIASIRSDQVLIADVQSALDLMMSVQYETGIRNLAIPKDCITEQFFILSSGLAGSILQKFVNYRFRVAIYGDYSKYTSKPLRDFIYESNHGRDVFFTSDLESAIAKLSDGSDASDR